MGDTRPLPGREELEWWSVEQLLRQWEPRRKRGLDMEAGIEAERTRVKKE